MSYAKRTDQNHAPIRDALRKCGWFVRDMSGVGQGWPDLYAVKGGRSLWVECKAERVLRHPKNGSRENATRDRQAETHAELRKFGAEVVVLTSLEQVKEL